MTKKLEWQIAYDKNQKQKGREILKEIKPGVREAWKTVSNRNKQPYDGVMGSPPKWTPGTLPREFVAARDRLLEQFSHKEILEYMDVRENLPTNRDFTRVAYYPPEYAKELETLIEIRWLVGLRKVEGLKAYQGRDGYKAVYGLAQSEMKSEFAGNRRGKLSPLNECIKILNPKDLKDLLRKFDNEDIILNLYEATKDPKIHIHNIKVNLKEGLVYYTPRNKDRKSVKLSTLGETISRMKSPTEKK